jgi:hypothetical protein
LWRAPAASIRMSRRVHGAECVESILSGVDRSECVAKGLEFVPKKMRQSRAISSALVVLQMTIEIVRPIAHSISDLPFIRDLA